MESNPSSYSPIFNGLLSEWNTNQNQINKYMAF